MKLFVANTSKQLYRFTHRTAQGRIIELPVPIGGQIVALDGDKDEVEAAVAHHARYGMKSVSEAVNQRGFIGQVYSVDREISGELIAANFVDNDAALRETAEVQRKIEAAAIAGNLSVNGIEAGQVTVETTEVVKSGESAQNKQDSTVIVEGKGKK